MASWERYSKMISIPNLPDEIENSVDILTNAVIDAAKASIPITKPTKSHRPVPWWNDDIRDTISGRKKTFNKFNKQPTLDNLINLKKARAF
ncbi:hypothetical protein JTB14_004553 [Gonioctena quinquepunctata]|nr:hypothetical protein JTB14_004553 [Gonioctena quinquepunctata]